MKFDSAVSKDPKPISRMFCPFSFVLRSTAMAHAATATVTSQWRGPMGGDVDLSPVATGCQRVVVHIVSNSCVQEDVIA